MILRLARGEFNPDRAQDVRQMLIAAEATLRPAVAKLPGLVHFYVGLDSVAGELTNTGIWRTPQQANGMSTLAELAQLRPHFVEANVSFQKVRNYEIVWQHAAE